MMVEVEQWLRSYLEDKARLEYLQLSIAQMLQHPEDVILSMALSPYAGKNPTQSAALGYQTQLMRETDALNKEMVYLQRRVKRVDILLSALNERERLIVKTFYVHGYPWEDVVLRYEREMPSGRSKSTLKAMRDQLLRKLARIAADGFAGTAQASG